MFKCAKCNADLDGESLTATMERGTQCKLCDSSEFVVSGDVIYGAGALLHYFEDMWGEIPFPIHEKSDLGITKTMGLRFTRFLREKLYGEKDSEKED